MAAFDFPSGPTVGQVYTQNGVTYRYDGQAWIGGPVQDTGTFVQKAGDTMTGLLTAPGLTVAPSSDQAPLTLKGAAGGANPFVNAVAGLRGALNRWVMMLGNGGAESGGNVGSDLVINRYDDSGAFIDSPLFIERKTGKVTLGLNQISNVPQCLAHRGGAGSVALGTATWTKANMGTILSTGASGYFNLSGGGGGGLQVLKPGIYFVQASICIQTPTQICNILGGFGYNSNTTPSRMWRSQNPVANNWIYTFPCMGVFNCAANDYFSVMGYVGVAGASMLDTSAETNIGAFLLAAT